MRSWRCKIKAVQVSALIAFGVLLFPGAAAADCPPPQTPPTADKFYFCFDGSKIGPQPIIGADNGAFIVVDVEINGHKLAALLDTGAEISTIDASVAKQIGLKAGGSYRITALGGQDAPAQKAPIDQLVIGGFIRKGGIIGVADLSAVRQAAPQPFALLLGADVLLEVALYVDRDNQTLVVIPNNGKATGANWVVPIQVRQPGNMLMTSLSVDGHPMTVKLDTGAEDDLILRDAKWAEIVPTTARVTTLGGGDLAGSHVVPMVRLNSVRMGDKVIGDAIATQGTNASVIGQADGIIGMGILSRYTLFLNPQARTMVLAEPKRPARPRRETMAGIQGLPTDDGLIIMHVMAHSPAEAAGLKAGDRICTVDGETVRAAWLGTPKNDWMLGPEGKTVLLGRCGGEAVRFTLRRFY